MRSRFAHLAQHMFDAPLVIHPRKAQVIIMALRERLGISSVSGLGVKMDDDEGDGDFYAPARGGRTADNGYDMIGPVARIPVEGTLVNKLGSLRPYSGMTGYDSIRQALLSAMGDNAVEGIVFDIDSPGGEAAGCFDLVDTIYGLRGIKPMAAILTENAFSGGYGIASAVDPGSIYLPRTGGVGSIGVIWAHVDESRALDKDGLTVTFLTHGARKADGHSEFPLSPEARDRYQAEIDAMGEIFDQTVARNRGLASKTVASFEAGCFMGPEGVKLGLADAVMAPDAAFRAFIKTL